jgi:hypothetical protein
LISGVTTSLEPCTPVKAGIIHGGVENVEKDVHFDLVTRERHLLWVNSEAKLWGVAQRSVGRERVKCGCTFLLRDAAGSFQGQAM